MDKVEIIAIKCGLANVFILKGRKTVIVDTGLKGSTDKIIEELKRNGIDRKDISLILLTHVHPDHCLNAKHLKESLGVPLAVNSMEAGFLEIGEFSPVIPTGLTGKLIFRSLKSIHEKHGDIVKADITFDKELSLKEYGIDAKAVVMPGHSLGSTAIFFDDQRCIVGDFIIESVVRKAPSLPPFAVDLMQLKSNVRSILNSGVKNVYSSHGTVWDVEYLKKVLLTKLG